MYWEYSWPSTTAAGVDRTVHYVLLQSSGEDMVDWYGACMYQGLSCKADASQVMPTTSGNVHTHGVNNILEYVKRMSFCAFKQHCQGSSVHSL
jgi:hypothetical protein